MRKSRINDALGSWKGPDITRDEEDYRFGGEDPEFTLERLKWNNNVRFTEL